MPADTDIILSAGNIKGPDPNTLVSMFSLAQQVQAAKQESVKKNALLQAFSDPNSVDPATGTPTPQAIRKVMTVDPQMGLKLQDDALTAQVTRAQAAHYKTEAGKNNFDFMSGVAGVGYDAYDAAKKAGKSETDAIAAGQTARNEAAKNNGGVVGDDIVDGITGKPFDPAGARALAGTNKEWSAQRHQTETLDRQVSHDDAMEKHSQAMEDLARRGQNIRIDTGQAAKWQVLTDPKSQTQYRYNPETGQSTTLNGKEAYEPGGAAKLGGGSAPRSAAAAYIQKFMQDNPSATADEISSAASKFRMGQSEAGTIGTRAGAADVAAKDVEIFAKQARTASEALKRTDNALANEVLQKWDMNTKNPELRKLMIAADALVNSRARAISPTGSPHVNDQLEGRKMLSAAFAKGDFEAAVQQMEAEASGVYQATRETKQAFVDEGKNSKKDAAPKVTAVSDEGAYNALPKGAWYSKPGDPAGTHRVKQ